MRIDIFDKKAGDLRQQLVTPELVEKEINPRLAKGFMIVGINKDGHKSQMKISRQTTVYEIDKQIEENDFVDLAMRHPLTAG